MALRAGPLEDRYRTGAELVIATFAELSFYVVRRIVA
jgi:hypothetical protein